MKKHDILMVFKNFQKSLNIKSSIDISWENWNELIEEISVKDSKVAQILAGLEKSIESILFFEKDKEMRIKFPDIFKMQLDEQKKEIEIQKVELIQIGEKYGLDISQILSDLNNSKLDINDILNKD